MSEKRPAAIPGALGRQQGGLGSSTDQLCPRRASGPHPASASPTSKRGPSLLPSSKALGNAQRGFLSWVQSVGGDGAVSRAASPSQSLKEPFHWSCSHRTTAFETEQEVLDTGSFLRSNCLVGQFNGYSPLFRLFRERQNSVQWSASALSPRPAPTAPTRSSSCLQALPQAGDLVELSGGRASIKCRFT